MKKVCSTETEVASELHIVWRHNTTLKIEIPRELEDDLP